MTQPSTHESSPPHPPPGSVRPAEARRKTQARLSAIVAALVACLGAATSLGPGPGFVPLWLGILLALLGTAWFLTEVRSWRTGAPSRRLGDDEEAPEYSLPTAAAIVVSLCVLAACLEVVGYQLSMLAFLLFHLLVLGKRGLLLSIVIALAGSFGVFVVFTQLLGVPLPASSLPLLRGLGL